MLRHLLRVGAENHVGNIEQPPVEQRVLGIGCAIGKERRVALGGFGGPKLFLVHALTLHGENARIGIVIPRAVLQLAKAKVGEREISVQRLDIRCGKRRAVLREQLLDGVDCRPGHAAGNVLLSQLPSQNEALDRAGLGSNVGLQTRDLPLLQIPRIVPGTFVLGEVRKRLHHIELLP